jgi:diguanylate cyclase (GGDEF)-like protein
MNEADLRELIDDHPYGIAELTEDGRYLFFNEKERLFRGLSRNQMQAAYVFDFFNGDDALRLNIVFNECLTSRHKHPHLFNYKEGTRYFQMRLSKSESGGIISSLAGTTELDVLNASYLADKEHIKRLSDALDAANIGCWDFYPQEDRIIATETWVTQKKYKDEDFRANKELFSDVHDGLAKWAEIVHPDDLDGWKAIIGQHLNGETETYESECRIKSGDGDWAWIRSIGKATEKDKDGKVIRMNGVHIDITKAREFEEEISKISTTDPLTGLLNRRKFESLFDDSHKQTAQNKVFSFLFLDVDCFKEYNDIYGHQAGDDVLLAISEVVKNSLRRTDDHCFRLGGEEFGIVFKSDDKQSAMAFAQLLKKNIESLSIPHKKNMASRYVTVSMGLVTKQDYQSDDFNRIYKQADDLLYKSKKDGRNILNCN